ncbi:MAG: SWIM zinc finger family protein [Saezia sp.]
MAPDASSVKAGLGLTNSSQWQTLGTDTEVLWGECKGSGKNPYQTQIDLSTLTTRCSCPSRKFPCKHALALMFLYADQIPQLTSESAPPQWVTEWMEGRKARAAKKEEKAANSTPVDPEKQAANSAKRQDSRWKRIEGGAGELQRWINDQFIQGFASFSPSHYPEWENMAARMVDAQAPGLARMVRDALSLMQSGSEHQQEAIEQLGLAQLLVSSILRRSELSPEKTADIQMALGWSLEKEEVQTLSASVTDTWIVLGQISEDFDSKLLERRIWLYGVQSKRYALLLDFAFKGQGLSWNWANQWAYQATLAFYPGSQPLRAIMLKQDEQETSSSMPAFSLHDSIHQSSALLAANPWLVQTPVVIPNALPLFHEEKWWVKTDEGYFALNIHEPNCWNLMAFSAGEPIDLFAEWNGRTLRPLAAQHLKEAQKFWNYTNPNIAI